MTCQASLNKCIDCEFKSFPVKGLNESELEKIERNCDHIYFNKNELIFKQGIPASYVIYIRKGFVKICNQNEKKDLIVQLVRSCNYIDLSSLFRNDTYRYSTITVEPSEICLIKKDTYLELMDKNSSFTKSLTEYICGMETFLINRLHSIIHKKVPGRLTDLFIYFSKEIFENNEFILPLSRTELADFIGTSKKSIINTLSEFKSDGLINMDGRKIEILRMDLLDRISKFG